MQLYAEASEELQSSAGKGKVCAVGRRCTVHGWPIALKAPCSKPVSYPFEYQVCYVDALCDQ